MFLPILLSTMCCWSYEDFKNEVDSEIYQINHQIKNMNISPENSYDFAYLKGKLDVYLSLKEGMDN